MKVKNTRSTFYIIILALLMSTLSMRPAVVMAQDPSQGDVVSSYQGTLTAIPDADFKSGAPGSVVVFNVSLVASEFDSISTTTSNTLSWTINASPNPLDLTTKTAGSLELTVYIPVNARDGDQTTITANFTGSPNTGLGTSLTLTVKAISPQPTNPPQAVRPLVIISSYSMDKDTIVPGDSFNLYLSLKNEGGKDAQNLIFTFSGESFLPQETGGVVALGSIGAGGSRDISQRFWTSTNLWGSTNASLPVKVTYTDASGEQYSESFNLILAVRGTTSGQAPTATPTPSATPTTAPRPQLVVGSYQSDVDPLQPGSIFTLDLNIENLGNSDARGVTMVLGGGGSNLEPNPSGTPQPGGVSGGSGDLTNFAPIGSSNLVFLGDVAPGSSVTASQKLIVNVSANPGAYALKLSFVYSDPRGARLVDDQVITLLIYQLPQVEVNFYRDPGAIFAMQPNTLPVQVVNLGRKSTVMGNMTVTAENADLMNNVILVGTLDMGGYFPLDVMLIPHVAGPLDVNVTINYTDDFNQPRVITQVLHLEVMESGPVGPVGPDLGPDGMPINPGQGEVPGEPAVPETIWDKILRFFKGLFGLDSAPPQPSQPVKPGEQPVPNPAGGKG